eukprot:758868-Pelagomonas_calceolata.AAC.3
MLEQGNLAAPALSKVHMPNAGPESSHDSEPIDGPYPHTPAALSSAYAMAQKIPCTPPPKHTHTCSTEFSRARAIPSSVLSGRRIRLCSSCWYSLYLPAGRVGPTYKEAQVAQVVHRQVRLYTGTGCA